MRTCYEMEQTDEYLAARELLLRRCEAWAAADGLTFSGGLGGALLDSRHFSADGRLGYWTPAQVRRAFDWIVEKVTPADDKELLAAPETLRILLRYLDAHGLRDPRGATPGENLAAIDAAAAGLAVAIGDQSRYGVAKIMAMTARSLGLDITDPEQMAGFMQDLQNERVVPDEKALARALERQASGSGAGQGRTFPQLPVSLPPAAELTEAAEHSTVVRQLRGFVQWLGPAGRVLTPSGNLKPADARELLALLGTDNANVKFRSAAELTGLTRLVSWAMKTRLVRRQGGRLVPVAKASPVLADADALWLRAFEAVFGMGDTVCRPRWTDEPPSPVQRLYDDIVPDVLASCYGLPIPLPVARLAESVWGTVEVNFDLSSLSEESRMFLRLRADGDLADIFDAFELLGAMTSIQAVADAMFSEDLDDEKRELRAKLAEPGRLVGFAPLGTRAMRHRLLAEGREAALIGELVDATAAELLGTMAEHYPPDSRVPEMAGWRAARAGAVDPATLEPLVQAIRDCPFITRQEALIKTLVECVPEGDELLGRLLDDPQLGPVTLLTQRDVTTPETASPDEAEWMLVGSMLELLEMGGPDAVRAQLSQLPREQQNGIVQAVCESGYPARETLEEFRRFVGGAQARRLHVVRNAHPRRSQAGKRRRH